jgi:hypothetical protein
MGNAGTRFAGSIIALVAFMSLFAGVIASPAGAADPTLPINWVVKASTHLKKLNQTVVVPPGRFAGSIDLATGDLTGNLTLPPASTEISGAGIPLAKATFQMTQTKPITGHVNFSTLQVTTTASFNIRVVSVDPLGLPVNLVGDRCTTSKPITLTLGGPVNLAKGSTFSGTYTIPPLMNCGLTTPALNLRTAGPGNTFTATFAPPPTSSS